MILIQIPNSCCTAVKLCWCLLFQPVLQFGRRTLFLSSLGLKGHSEMQHAGRSSCFYFPAATFPSADGYWKMVGKSSHCWGLRYGAGGNPVALSGVSK